MKRIITAVLVALLCLGTVTAAVSALSFDKLSEGTTNSQLYEKYIEAKNLGKVSELDDPWQSPEYVSKETTVEDSYLGTLKYTENDDGTVTVSYKVNGEDRTYTFVNDPNYTSGGYAAKDDVGRVLPDAIETGIIGENGEHYVGLFYFLWMGEHGDSGVYNLEEIRLKYGENAKNAAYRDPETRKTIYGGTGVMHYFAEPLYGYYYSSDEWVMRKHIELLTEAGVDFLYLDVTNGYPYLQNATKLMKIIHEYVEMGYNPPRVVFYTNSNSISVMKQLDEKIYSENVYPDAWFYVDGKPCIIGDSTQATTRSDIQALNKIKEKFTFKETQWPNDRSNPLKDNAWPWMSFTWPQGIHKDSEGNPSAINVSIAQHCGSVCFSFSSLYYDYNTELNRGRSYDGENKLMLYRMKFDKDPTLSYLGLNFQHQWDYAIENDVKFVLVTGWNEWVAQRQKGADDNQVVFIDTASVEFSRDAEMMRGGYFDNYYMQIIYNIQKLKGSAPNIVQDARNPINVTGDFSQWDKVLINYRDGEGDTVDRDGMGFGKQNYTDKSGRNDIVNSKVTNDTKNVYFYVETKDAIQRFDGESSWMQLFLNSDNDPETGWYGYDFIVNYDPQSDCVTSIAKYSGENGEFGFTNVANVTYHVEGNKMMIEVPLEVLGIEDYRQIYLEFKWADADEGVVYDEMEDFYLYGDVAPAGRLNYIYQTYIPGESVFEPLVKEDESTTGEEISTDAEDDATTAAPADTAVETGTSASTEKQGCGSAVSGIFALTATAVVCYGIAKKKKDE